MIAEILPETAVGAEAFGDRGCAIFPVEADLVAGAVGKRRREFATGRLCARRALTALGLPPAPVLSGARGEPVWPPGVVGSITHCKGYRACAVARATDLPSLGIDAEPHLPLPRGVLGVISSSVEREQLHAAFAGDPSHHWDRLLFCVKEAVFKAWYPRGRALLEFSAVAIELDPAAGRFSAAVAPPGPGAGPAATRAFSGRWRLGRGLVVVVARPAHRGDRLEVDQPAA